MSSTNINPKICHRCKKTLRTDEDSAPLYGGEPLWLEGTRPEDTDGGLAVVGHLCKACDDYYTAAALDAEAQWEKEKACLRCKKPQSRSALKHAVYENPAGTILRGYHCNDCQEAEDKEDIDAAESAIREMENTGEKLIPWEKVKLDE